MSSVFDIPNKKNGPHYTGAGVKWEAKAKSCVTDSAQRAICHISRIDEEQSLNASGKREMLKKVLIK